MEVALVEGNTRSEKTTTNVCRHFFARYSSSYYEYTPEERSRGAVTKLEWCAVGAPPLSPPPLTLVSPSLQWWCATPSLSLSPFLPCGAWSIFSLFFISAAVPLIFFLYSFVHIAGGTCCRGCRLFAFGGADVGGNGVLKEQKPAKQERTSLLFFLVLCFLTLSGHYCVILGDCFHLLFLFVVVIAVVAPYFSSSYFSLTLWCDYLKLLFDFGSRHQH